MLPLLASAGIFPLDCRVLRKLEGSCDLERLDAKETKGRSASASALKRSLST